METLRRDLQLTLRQMRVWKVVALVALLLASGSVLLSAVLFGRVTDTTNRLALVGRANCRDNRRQDTALLTLVRVSLDSADPHMHLTKRQRRAKRAFVHYVHQVEREPRCVKVPVP